MNLCLSFSKPSLKRLGAFTLIELLVVMLIILILAGIILAVAGSAQNKAAVSRAKGEIKAMETALEAYKSDNGSYPSDPNSSEQLNAQQNFDPGNVLYQKSSEFLYQALSGLQPATAGTTTPSTTAATKAYLSFKANQLLTANDAPGGAVASPTSPYMYIVDPFGLSYGYSTAYQAALNASATNPSGTPNPSPTPPTGVGYNPTFDLWSTGGYGTGGKATPSNLASPGTAAAYSSIWITNW